MVAGLAEAFHFADRHDLDVHQLQAILDAGPMASNVSRVKGAKLANGDFTVQSAIGDVLKNAKLTVEAARRKGIASPLLDTCVDLYGEAVAEGCGSIDMAGVIKTIEKRSAPRKI